MSSSGAPATAAPSAPVALPKRREYVVILGTPVGKPQIVAGFLLLLFLGQCIWLAMGTPMREMELARIRQGEALLHGQADTGPVRSPVVAVLAAMPLVGSGVSVASDGPAIYAHPPSWRWRARLPFLAIGVLLGSSLWYVARRLYGNAGGYIALALYAFCPAIILRAAAIEPAIVAAWGAFGAVFTAIAVAHTLYAPREVVLWNWKRIGLLGLAIALAVGSQLALSGVILLAFAFLLYLVPERRGSALAIIAASGALAFLLLWGACGLDLHALGAALGHIRRADFAPSLLVRPLTYTLVGIFFLRMPGVSTALAAALIGYAAWRRPRFFGVSAPLLAFAVVMVLGVALPHLGGYNLFVAALPFAFVFVAGVFADLLETRYANLVLGVLAGVLLAHAVYSLTGLMRIR